MPKFTSKTPISELIQYGEEELGVDLTGLERDEVVAALIRVDKSLFSSNTKTKAKVVIEEKNPVKKEKSENPTHMTINIHDNDDDDEFAANYVPIGFNGRMYQVQKGVDAKVPYGVFDVLNNAVEINYKQRTDDVTKMKYLEEKRTKRWPFQIIERHYD